jgi:hypothetical protein
MPGKRLDSAQELFGLRLEYGNGIIRTCESLHCFDRLKQIHHREFHFQWSVAAKHVAGSLTLDTFQTGKH